MIEGAISAVGAMLLLSTFALQRRDMFARISEKNRNVIFLSAVIIGVGLVTCGLALMAVA